jgi:hypothetical protein
VLAVSYWRVAWFLENDILQNVMNATKPRIDVVEHVIEQHVFRQVTRVLPVRVAEATLREVQ